MLTSLEVEQEMAHGMGALQREPGGHGPTKIMVGGTMHLAPPIIGLYIC